MTVPPDEYAVSPKLLNESIVRRQISQSSSKELGVRVTSPTGPIDADTVNVVVAYDPGFLDAPGATVIEGSLADGTILREDVGVYATAIGPQITNTPGLLDVTWTYTVNGQSFTYTDHYQVTEPMPFYEGLSDSQKFVIEQVTWMMGDLFDSTTGGPHLVEEFQTHFGYERLAQLLQITVSRINTMSQPLTSFIIGSPVGGMSAAQFPENFSNVLVIGLYIETIKHFIRSYVEQPNIMGGTGVAFADRRDYMQRWQAVLQDEMEDFKSAVRMFKRKQMNLGQGSFIVSGGIFGAAGGGRFTSGQWAAATRGARFMPTSFVLPGGGWGSGAGAVQH